MLSVSLGYKLIIGLQLLIIVKKAILVKEVELTIMLRMIMMMTVNAKKKIKGGCTIIHHRYKVNYCMYVDNSERIYNVSKSTVEKLSISEL